MEYKEYATITTEKQNKYILDVWGSFDEFYEDMEGEVYITLPIDCIVPNSDIEWDNAEAFNSYTDSLIELTYSKLQRSNQSLGAELVVHDGHNRLKTAIAKGETKIRCKIV